MVVTFKIKNDVSTDTPLTIKGAGDKSYFCKHRNGKLKAVSVVFSGVDVKEAPTIAGAEGGKGPSHVSVDDGYSLLAERDIRAWQSIMAPYNVIDIDFSVHDTAYYPEGADEEKEINIKSFKVGFADHKGPKSEDFSIYGRAFLAIPDHYDDIQKMAFYVDGIRHMSAGRYVDAYNSFYLFLEANFNLKFKTDAATKALLKVDEFVQALKEAATSTFSRPLTKKLSLKGVSSGGVEPEALTRSIVELRGHLRHNTLSNPNRWDPHNQDKHNEDASFLARVCQALAQPTFNETFDPKYADEFLRLAKESNHLTTARVTITMKDVGAPLATDIYIDINLPTKDNTPNLAKAILERALQFANENAPGAEIFAIRAVTIPRGVELFRYDLGPQIGRD